MALPGQKTPDINQMRQNFYKSKADEVNRQFTGAQQQQEDAMARRFASIGQSASGAAIGAGIKGRAELEGQRSSALNALAGQQAQENVASQEAQLARDFQGSEAQKNRDLQSGQFGQEFGLKQSVFDLEKQSKLRELDMAQRQMLNDEATTAYNQAMTTIQSPYSADRLQRDVNDILRQLEQVRAGRIPQRPVAPPAPRTRTIRNPMSGETYEGTF